MIDILELRNAVRNVFPTDDILPDRTASWQRVSEMGWLLSDLPEELGGLGLGREALAAICFEQGRVLSSAPLIPAFLALDAIAASPHLPDQAGWIAKICDGDYIPLNMLPSTIEFDPAGRLRGQLSGVQAADMATHVLAGAPGFYGLIPLGTAGVTTTERSAWDRSRRFFDVTLENVTVDPALMLVRDEAAACLHERLAGTTQLLLAADALGGADAALGITVEYLKVRRQFERPIAMFQAIKHRCADMKSTLASAEALLWSRARQCDPSVVDLGALKAHACTVFGHIAEEMIQLHGGIGLTNEHLSHLFLKRAMLDLQLCGSVDHWREKAGLAALGAFAAA